MGKTKRKGSTSTSEGRPSQSVLSSPSHSSSSSDFEFTVALSPSKNPVSAVLCPADELFYKGQLLPLQLSPRLSMVRTILLASTSGCDSLIYSSRDSTASSSSSYSIDRHFNTDSSGRSSSVADEEYRGLNTTAGYIPRSNKKYLNRYFSLSRFASVFKEAKLKRDASNDVGSAPVRKVSSSAREVLRKYLKKVKPFYQKLAHDYRQHPKKASQSSVPIPRYKCVHRRSDGDRHFSQSFSGNLRFPTAQKGTQASSCPSSMRSSPNHSGLLCMNNVSSTASRVSNGSSSSWGGDTLSSMEELQSAIQGAIAHCKNSLLRKQ